MTQRRTKVELETSKITATKEAGKNQMHKIVLKGETPEGAKIKMEIEAANPDNIRALVPFGTSIPVTILLSSDQMAIEDYAVHDAETSDPAEPDHTQVCLEAQDDRQYAAIPGEGSQ